MNEGPRIIVCGGRDYADRDRVYHEIQRFRGYDPVIVHGAAHGADRLADEVATELGLATGAAPGDVGSPRSVRRHRAQQGHGSPRR